MFDDDDCDTPVGVAAYPDYLSRDEFSQKRIDPDLPETLRSIGLLEGSLLSSENDLREMYALGGCLPPDSDEWSWGQYCPSQPREMARALGFLQMQHPLVPGSRFCDLGIGRGYPVAVFAAAGLRTYGLDISRLALDYAPQYFEVIQERFGRFRYAPQIAELDVESPDIGSFQFNDGARMTDMDIFLCNIGDYDHLPKRIMKNLFGVKSGTIWCRQLIGFAHTAKYMDNIMTGKTLSLRDTPFRPIFRHPDSLLIAE